MMENKYIGTLIGCAIGDTLGMPVEGWKKEQIKKYVPHGKITKPIDPIIVYADGKEVSGDEFGKLKYWTRDLKKGEWTDDTILTVAIAESIVRSNGLDLDDMSLAHLEAYESLRLPNGKIKGGFGVTTQEAFRKLREGTSPFDSGVIGGPGNAPAMKASPLGMYAHATGSLEKTLQFAEALGRMTHLDPRSVASGVVQTGAIFNLLDGVSRKEFISAIYSLCEKYERPLDERFTWHKKGSLLSRIEWIRDNPDASSLEAHEILGSSSAVYQSYPFALFMFQRYWDNPIDGLLETVNYGGDCDTTGSMFGALAGAKNGMIFPKKWMDVLEDKDKLINLGGRLYQL